MVELLIGGFFAGCIFLMLWEEFKPAIKAHIKRQREENQ